MEDRKETDKDLKKHPLLDRKTSGILLIVLGLGLAATSWLNFAWVPVWLAGLALLTLGTVGHKPNLIAPGGIITGTGLAIVVQTSPWIATLSDQARTGLFLICMALGWLLIPLLSRLAATNTRLWPLIPGGVLLITGLVYWASNGWVKVLSGLVWPVSLMVVGLFLIIHWSRTK